MPPKNKPDTAGYEKLKRDLAAGEPDRLYIFHGEETYLRDSCLRRLQEAILTGGLGEFNRHNLSARDMSPRALEEALDCLPMMADRTFVLVTDYDIFKAGEKDREEYLRILSNLPDYCCLVLLYDLIEYKPDARTKLAGAVKKHGTAVNFVRQDQRQLVKWVQAHFQAAGKSIEPRLCEELIFLCGDLMQNLGQEVEKIAAYARGPQVAWADIEAVAAPQLSAVVFRIADAIGEKNYDRAAAVLGELYQMQKTPYEIMGAFGKQFRQFYSARLALSEGKGASYVAQLWGMRYPADRLVNAARRLPLPWCRQAVIRCAQTDLAMKSTGQDPKELMTTLLLELANMA